MPFDALFDLDLPVTPDPRRATRGLANYHSGMAAESVVAHRYQARGDRIAARRWRGSRGELDLVVQGQDGLLVFVEVKHARNHDLAACRVSRAQLGRLVRTSEEYRARQHGTLDVDMRFDLALVDAMGRIEVIENAFFE